MSDAADMIRLKTQRLRDTITEKEDERWREIVEDFSGRNFADSGALIDFLCKLVVEDAREIGAQLISIYVDEFGLDLDLDAAANEIAKVAKGHFASGRERILGMHAMDLKTRTTIYQRREQELDTKLTIIRADLQIAVWDLKKSQEPTTPEKTPLSMDDFKPAQVFSGALPATPEETPLSMGDSDTDRKTTKRSVRGKSHEKRDSERKPDSVVPEDTTWPDVTFQFKDDDNVQMRCEGCDLSYHFSELGMKDKKTDSHTKAWDCFRAFARGAGFVLAAGLPMKYGAKPTSSREGFGSEVRARKEQEKKRDAQRKQIETLRKKLQDALRIPGNPIGWKEDSPDGSGWQSNFRIFDS